MQWENGMSKRTIGLLAGFLVLVTAASGQDADSAAGAGNEPACFSIRQAQTISALNDRFVYLEGSGSRRFLLTMTGNCPGLGDVSGLAVQNRGQDRVCSGDSAQVTYRLNRNGPLLTCVISTVTSVASEEEAESLAESLTADR